MTTAENRNLQDMIIDVKVPVEIVNETVGDKTTEVENKLFPGYVFVKMVYTCLLYTSFRMITKWL